jgi:hypothetical protein
VSAIPAGPWLLVVGMHRSGTSAITGALGALGLQAMHAKDRMDSPRSNPEHWESKSLSHHNDRILRRMGASWDAPTDLPLGWHVDPDIVGDVDLAALVTSAYPEPGPSVWKDPRLCLLLPYWRSVLPAPLAAVFVWRSPLLAATRPAAPGRRAGAVGALQPVRPGRSRRTGHLCARLRVHGRRSPGLCPRHGRLAELTRAVPRQRRPMERRPSVDLDRR